MIVLAGGIGSGKSVAARILRSIGYGVFDCDYEAALLMNTDSVIREEIKDVAGEDVYAADFLLDRKLLAARIFSDSGLRRKVNEIVHAAVRKAIERWLKLDERNIFVETAIAAESGIAASADEIWIVEAPLETRIERVASRDSRPREEIMNIIKAQEKEYESLMDSGVPVTVIQNGDSDSLLSEILRLEKEKELNKITHRHA